MDPENSYIYHGFSGLDEVFENKGEVRFFWKEYMEYELSGTDKDYLLYQDKGYRIISVDSTNNIIDEVVDSFSSLNIISANSNVKFKVSEFNTCRVPPSKYQKGEKVFVISDIEGDFDKFSRYLCKIIL
ncbi:MAG: hypothetical protein HC831_10170 [Chloroflexia bacterium]|nr:hypothetical protein [Chloroflexia bacterium]